MSDGRVNRDHRIRISAYHLWESDGRPDGQESGHWKRAESLCEHGTIDCVQGAELLSGNNSKLLRAFKNTTGEPDAPRYLECEA